MQGVHTAGRYPAKSACSRQVPCKVCMQQALYPSECVQEPLHPAKRVYRRHQALHGGPSACGVARWDGVKTWSPCPPCPPPALLPLSLQLCHCPQAVTRLDSAHNTWCRCGGRRLGGSEAPGAGASRPPSALCLAQGSAGTPCPELQPGPPPKGRSGQVDTGPSRCGSGGLLLPL